MVSATIISHTWVCQPLLVGDATLEVRFKPKQASRKQLIELTGLGSRLLDIES